MIDGPCTYIVTKPGDVVWLKSGGPPMVVTSIFDGASMTTMCEWFSGTELKRDAFDRTNLANRDPATPVPA